MNSLIDQIDVASEPAVSRKLVGRPYPQVIKYMGSKAKIIDFVIEGINSVYNEGAICDLFAGACTLSGSIGHSAQIITNDIQEYSKILAHVYLHPASDGAKRLPASKILEDASLIADELRAQFPPGVEYPAAPSLQSFLEIEEINRSLIDHDFEGSHHLFTKYYSGTWWSAEQCAWIDALRCVADRYVRLGILSEGDSRIFLSCLMHAMAYCGQGTGHYAQYRDAKTLSALADINGYRQKNVGDLFARKWTSLIEWNSLNVVSGLKHIFLSEDYESCLARLRRATVYADPPYAFVHYSRFYHAIETLALYDYPSLQIKGGQVVKGRYRESRHQSPFCIRTQVPTAFRNLFNAIDSTESNLVLSYSNTGLFALPEMVDLAHECLGPGYDISVLTTDHTHMTMGRREDRDREVEEALLLAARRD